MEYLKALAFLLLLAGQSLAQSNTYRVCTDLSKSFTCQGVELGDSRVSCVTAETNIDCALRIAAGEADFGVFTEEEVFLLAQQQPDSHAVVASIRHQDKLTDAFAFESVALVRSTHSGGLQALRGTGFCHPGYNYREHRWSPRVLKYFEDEVAQTSRNCDSSARTPAASQANALSNFFSSACRPGPWSQDPIDDAQLKTRFPTLCDLCINRNCSNGYATTGISVGNVNSHQLALQCVAGGSGNVTYVAWQHVRTFFQGRTDVNSFSLLCQDGTLRPLSADVLLNSTAPCSWVRQPWSAVVSSRGVSTSLLADLRVWMPTGRSQVGDGRWTDSLDQILFSEPSVRLVFNEVMLSPTDYVTPARGPPSALDTSTSCQRVQRWCTISAAETLKCNWIRRAAISLGVEPAVECVQFENEIACLNNIQMERADFISLDSNYGYLARHRYKLGSVLYHQTQRAHSSRVVALLKTTSTDSSVGGDNSSSITRFENLRGKTACFPEYGGIAWVSFVRAAHERQVISETECNYPAAVSEFFGAACAPGAALSSHSLSTTPATLCGACRANPSFPAAVTTTTTPAPGSAVSPPSDSASLTCGADFTNLYFSTNGTLACIAAAHTDVAFIETQYLATMFAAQNLNPNSFRVLCRNNSLAAYTGVNVDEACLLSYTVDGELLARRDWEQSVSLKSLFLTLDDLFGYTTGVNQLINLKIYSPFNRISNLLFKDSAIGLADSNSTFEQARNYEELFRHLDACSAAPGTTTLPPTPSAARVLMPLITMAVAPLLARLMV